MKVFALAAWIISTLDDQQRKEVKDKIFKDGIYSRFHGDWWIRLTKNGDTLIGQLNDVGQGTKAKVNENSFSVEMPFSCYQDKAALISDQKLSLDMLIDAKDIPKLKALNSRYKDFAEFGFASQWEQISEKDLWE